MNLFGFWGARLAFGGIVDLVSELNNSNKVKDPELIR